MALLNIGFHSETLKMDTGISVIMPLGQPGLGQECVKKEQYPVLWLLHGRGDDNTSWVRKTAIERYVSSLGLMVIMPEASYSRYLNMVHGPRFYDYITEELPEFCEKLFPKMSRKRADNYIAGLSMGGCGAIWIGLHNPEKYGAICMLSTGGIAPLEHLWRGKKGIPDPNPTYLKCNKDIYGVEDSNSLEDTEYDIIEIIEKTAKEHSVLPKVYHAMGIEDIRYPVAMKLKETFEGIPGNPYQYEYHEGPGKHEWVFWDEWINKFLQTLPLKGGR